MARAALSIHPTDRPFRGRNTPEQVTAHVVRIFYELLSLWVIFIVDDGRSGQYDSLHGRQSEPEPDTTMDLEYRNSDLEQLETSDVGQGRYGVAVVKAFRKVIRFIRAAGDERDFRAMRSLNFEKLKGNRAHQHSFKLNDQWRLIVEIKEGTPKNIIVVIEIADYH